MTSPRERKRCVFTKEETMLIINLWKEEKIQSKFKNTLKHNFIWEQLSRELSVFGYSKSGDEIKRKVQNLKHEYKTMKQIPGFDLKAWPFYNAMKDIMEWRQMEKGNVHVEDEHDYAEPDNQETDEHSSGSWMLMELKDISNTNSENFQEVAGSMNTVIIEETDLPTEIVNDNTLENKIKMQSLLKNPQNILPQDKNIEFASTKTVPVKRNKRPLRFKNHPERRMIRTSHPQLSENRVIERLTGIQEREQRIDERERRINEREVRLEERERRIDDRERRIDEREKRIEDSERHLRERERRFEERDKKYEEREGNSSTAMCRFFDTCAQFLNQYSPTVNSQINNQTC